MTTAKLGSGTRQTRFGAIISRDYNMMVSLRSIPEPSAAIASKPQLLYPPRGDIVYRQHEEISRVAGETLSTFDKQSMSLDNNCLLNFYQSLETAAKAAQHRENGAERVSGQEVAAKGSLPICAQDYAVFSFSVDDAIQYYDLSSIVIKGFYD